MNGILNLMPTQKLNTAILLAAIEGFEQQKLRIDTQIAGLRAMLSPDTRPVVTPETPITKRRPMSAAARKRMSDAQRKRWAGVLDGAGHARTRKAETQAECSRQGRNRRRVEETLGGEESGSGEGSTNRRQKDRCKESRSGEGGCEEVAEEDGEGSCSGCSGYGLVGRWPDPYVSVRYRAAVETMSRKISPLIVDDDPCVTANRHKRVRSLRRGCV